MVLRVSMIPLAANLQPSYVRGRPASRGARQWYLVQRKAFSLRRTLWNKGSFEVGTIEMQSFLIYGARKSVEVQQEIAGNMGNVSFRYYISSLFRPRGGGAFEDAVARLVSSRARSPLSHQRRRRLLPPPVPATAPAPGSPLRQVGYPLGGT